MFQPDRNTLSKAVSPYLRQHADNPVHWQQWSQEAIDFARENNRPLFVSVGYSTCHWCHVMAAEAFSDPESARLLNELYVCIKVDREERPDIDQMMMDILVSISGQGGWPLNVFLTPGLAPIFALTYAPVHSNRGPGFIDIIQDIHRFYQTSATELKPRQMQTVTPASVDQEEINNHLLAVFDPEFGGFEASPKFPPHCSLLYLLYTGLDEPKLRSRVIKTLDVMALRGLQDHLQGGFFRYCVDASWTIPHFEKMLYDQAMLLWVYSLGYRVLGREEYRGVAKDIIRCLDQTFASDGLYLAGHDADTGHEEGATYVWSWDELRKILTEEEFFTFRNNYALTPEGNFEGRNHLIKIAFSPRHPVEEKLLLLRQARSQPAVDNKLLTAWNCLAGIGLIHAARAFNEPEHIVKAAEMARLMAAKHFTTHGLARFSLGEYVSQCTFLEDTAAFLLLITFLQEEQGGWDDLMSVLKSQLENFRTTTGWIGSQEPDLGAVPAGVIDQPSPSSSALAELALVRTAILNGQTFLPRPFVEPLYHDFMNIAALHANGKFHILTSPQPLSWDVAPANSIQIRGERFEDCYNGICRRFDSRSPEKIF